MTIKHEIRKKLWGLGYDFCRFEPATNPLARRKLLIRSFDIDLVLDVGANIGQYGMQLRELGFQGRIVSFEPMSAAFATLKEKAAGDSDWTVCNYALGDEETSREINISANSYSSSLLEVMPAHLESAPESRPIDREVVEIRRLDSIFADLCGTHDNIYMKIDTQGFEDKVLGGADESLGLIDTIQMEMSLVHLYEGALLMGDVLSLMGEKGYTLVALEPGFSDMKTGQMLQVDGIFHRFGSTSHEQETGTG